MRVNILRTTQMIRRKSFPYRNNAENIQNENSGYQLLTLVIYWISVNTI